MNRSWISLKSVIFFLIQGLIIILPWFFLPATSALSGMDNFNKSYFLFILSPLASFLYILFLLKQEKLKFQTTLLDIPLVIFFFFYSLASIFAIDWYASVFGSYESFAFPLILILGLLFFYFLATQLFISKRIRERVIKILILIFPLTVILAFTEIVLGQLSLGGTVSPLWRSLTLSLGSLEEVSIFLAIMNIIIIGLNFSGILSRLFLSRVLRLAINFFLVLSIIVLAIINFLPSWWCFLAGITVVNVFYFFEWSKTNLISAKSGFKKFFGFMRRVSLPLILFLLSLLYIGAGYYGSEINWHERRLVPKLELENSASYQIVKEVIKERPFLGYGPENFNYAFSVFRDPNLNHSDYWFVRFNRPASFLLALLAGTGILGFLSYAIVIITILILIYKYWSKYSRGVQGKRASRLPIVVSAGIASLILMQIIYHLNVWLWLFFFILLALFVRGETEINAGQDKVFIKEKTSNPRLFQFLTILLFLISAVWLVMVIWQGRSLVAQAFFNSAKSATNISERREKITKASKLNPYRYNYQIALAKFYKDASLRELEKTGGDKNLPQVENLVNQAIIWSQQAINTAPRAVATHETLGMVYRDISSYSPDSRNLAIKVFKDAQALEPTNPVILTELGRVYLESGLYSKAQEALLRSVELKPDYFDAQFYLARAYGADGKYELALEILNKISIEHANADTYYEQGKVLYNLGEKEEAINKFRKVISLQANHANALFSLAVALSDIGEVDEAILYLQRVMALNPANAQVKMMIDELKK